MPRATRRPRPSLALDAVGQVPRAEGRQPRQSRRLHGRRRRRRCRPTSTSICRARCTASPSIALHIVAVLSNTAPIGVTRGPGFAETVNIMERLIDAAARQKPASTAPSCAAFNMVPADAMPMTNFFGFQVDSGSLRRDAGRGPGARRSCTASPARRKQSETRRPAAWPGFCLPHQGHGRPAGGECRCPLRERWHDVALITGTQHIGQGHETTLPADPRSSPADVPNELHPTCARATPT